MIYQINIIKNLIKHDFYKIFIIFLILLSFLLIVALYSNVSIDLIFFNMLVGKIQYKTSDLIAILWHLFQIFITVYMIYKICLFETDNSLEFILLRTNYVELFIQKFIISNFFLLVFRVLFYFLISMFFLKYHFYSIFNFISTNIVYFIISFGVLIYFIIVKILNKYGVIINF